MCRRERNACERNYRRHMEQQQHDSSDHRRHYRSSERPGYRYHKDHLRPEYRMYRYAHNIGSSSTCGYQRHSNLVCWISDNTEQRNHRRYLEQQRHYNSDNRHSYGHKHGSKRREHR